MSFPCYNSMAADSYAEREGLAQLRDDWIAERSTELLNQKLASRESVSEIVDLVLADPVSLQGLLTDMVMSDADTESREEIADKIVELIEERAREAADEEAEEEDEKAMRDAA